MSRGPVRLAVLVLAELLGGCVPPPPPFLPPGMFSIVGTSTLNVGYDEAKAARGPLSAADPRRIRIEVTDRRLVPGGFIGYTRVGVVGLPTWVGPIVATQPVREIVQDALAAELRRNDHTVVPGEADRVLTIDIREFWLDIHEGFWSLRFSGGAAITMTVAEGRTGHALLTREYGGHAVEHGQGNRKGNWKTVMNAALERMMRDVAADPPLVEALRTPQRRP